jgi:hypothetical protein
MDEMHAYILEDLKREVQLHGLRSGEIIIELSQIVDINAPIEDLIGPFLAIHNIKAENRNFVTKEINLEKAINSIIYGFSVKPNYTKIDTVFSDTQKNKIAYTFIRLFDNPQFYSLNTRIYREQLDPGDFWETGGAIVVDKNMIGIIWVNDLYNKF